jgi:hypothetical protein
VIDWRLSRNPWLKNAFKPGELLLVRELEYANHRREKLACWGGYESGEHPCMLNFKQDLDTNSTLLVIQALGYTHNEFNINVAYLVLSSCNSLCYIWFRVFKDRTIKALAS